MVDVNKHNVFPTSLYNFEHKFENDELKTLVDHIQTKSIMDKDGEVVRRNGSQLENELHKLDIFSNLVKTIIEVTETVMEDKNYEGGDFIVASNEFKTKKGSAIVFPSNFMFPHAVKKVEKGTRYSIVTWLM